MGNNNLYSYHVFLFPFQWQFVGTDMKNKTLDERTCLKEIVNLFTNAKWKRGKYRIDTILNYNEYNYFYDAVRDVLFDEGKDLDTSIIANLSYDIRPDEDTYNIKVCTDSQKNTTKTYSQYHSSSGTLKIRLLVPVASTALSNRNRCSSGALKVRLRNPDRFWNPGRVGG